MTEPRVIKRYPNRRLYDFYRSRYVTIRDIRALVMGNIPFVVTDQVTEQDLTSRVLLQLLVALEVEAQHPTVNPALLIKLIRART